MKTKIYRMAAITALVFFSINACNDDDFITEKPTSFYTLENSFNTVSQVQASVTNMYVHIRYWFQRDYFLKGMGTDLLDAPFWRSSGNGTSNYKAWSADYNSVASVWDAFYQLVSYANQTLEGAESGKITWDKETDHQYVVAQSKFFRGFAYMTLGELFGGVPLVTQLYTTPKYDFVRSTREETYLLALKDLKEALAGMPDYPQEAGRIAKGATYHYLCETYLALATELGNQKAALDSSVAYATKAIQLHSLMTQRFGTRATPGGGAAMNGVAAYYADGNVFFDLFQRGNLDYTEGNKEALWTLENDYAVYTAYKGDNFLEYPRNFSPVLRDALFTKSISSKSPWAGLTTAYVGGRGVSNNAPTKYVTTTIWQGNFWQDMRNSPVNIRRDFVCMDPTSSYFGDTVKSDMLDQTTIERIYPIWTKFAPIDDWGYEDLAFGGNRSNIYRDDYACRLAETYLLRAEAYLREGNTSNAAADVNALRQRAQCAYLVTPGDVTLNLILDERARELFIEERRWCTLLRMGGTVAIDQIAKYSYYAGSESKYYQGGAAVPSGWNLFPIPQRVIDANLNAVLEQNPGWKK